MKITETLCDCGHIAKFDGFMTGYGTTIDGRKLCFACCGKQDEKALSEGTPVVMYICEDASVNANKPIRVKNWPGTLSIVPSWSRTRKVWNPFAGKIERTDVWFKVGSFRYWGFVQGSNQSFMPRRIK